VGDLGYIPYIPNSPTGGHSGRKTSHGGRTGYIYLYIGNAKPLRKWLGCSRQINLRAGETSSNVSYFRRYG
jgi:hypothetical protein